MYKHGYFLLLTVAVFVLGSTGIGFCWHGRNSVDVPLGHWSYDAVARLAVARLIDMSLLGTKPYTRRDFARMTQQAMGRVKQRDCGALEETSRLQELLYRLMDEYRVELVQMGEEMLRREGEQTPSFRYRLADPTRVEFVGVFAGNPVVGAPTTATRRALFDPNGVLMENQNGWRAADGINVRTEWGAWAVLDEWGAASVDAASFVNSDLQRVQMQEAYLRTSLWNLDLLAGRKSLWWGPGYHGALLLSNNARPLDMIRLSNRDPFALPWVLSKIGPMRLNFVLARLDSERRDFRNPYLNGMRMELSPATWLSLGVTRTIMLGGDGRNPTLSQYFNNIFLASGENIYGADRFNPTDTDQKAGVDFCFRLPDLSRFVKVCREIEIYGELAGEDEALYVGFLSLPSNWAFLAGAYIPDVFMVDGFDLRLEWAVNQVAMKTDTWYNHGIYTDGYTINGRVIGHHMGTQAEDYFVRLSKSFERGFEVSAHFDLERHGVNLPNTETKYEGQIDFSYPVSESARMRMLYRVQHYTNADNVSGVSRANHIFGLIVERSF